jgi:myosin heavy subunit
VSITIRKVTEKNTKKQILEEFEKALKLIEELKAEVKRGAKKSSNTPKTQEIESKKLNDSSDIVSINELIDRFNKFSNRLKDSMIKEIDVIDRLRREINAHTSSIKNIYLSNPAKSLGDLISEYKRLIEGQKEEISKFKESATKEIEDIKEKFDLEKIKHKESFFAKESEFKRRVERSKKSDAYDKIKAEKALKEKIEKLISANEIELEELKDRYELENREAYRDISKRIEEYNETLEKAKKLKEEFDSKVEAKVSTVVNKEKASNKKAYESMVNEYQSKIKLKTIELDSLQAENDTLNNQIDKLIKEINSIQEKAHILASKTIEAKSATESFKAMKDVAMEQARGKK